MKSCSVSGVRERSALSGKHVSDPGIIVQNHYLHAASFGG